MFKLSWLREGRAVFFVTVGLATSVFLSIVVFFFEYGKFSNNAGFCAVAAVVSVAMASLALIPFFFREFGRPNLLFVLLVQGASMVLLFAGLYRGFGLRNNENIEPATALYFSIVTWTTLGYGDYQPKPELQLIAAFQASLGYLFLGLVVAVLASMLSERN